MRNKTKPVIKFTVNGEKIGFFKTEFAKYYLSTDGLITVVPRGLTESILGGRIKSGRVIGLGEYAKLVILESKTIKRIYSVLKRI